MTAGPRDRLPDGIAAGVSDEIAGIIAGFAAVPLRARHDGWTAARQRAFVAALADTASVTAAARAAGMTARSAYRLRARADADGFAEAWDAVAGLAADGCTAGLLRLAIEGAGEPLTYHGRRIGDRTRHYPALAMALLRRFDRMRGGAGAAAKGRTVLR